MHLLFFIRGMKVYVASKAEKNKTQVSPIDQTNTPPNSDSLIFADYVPTDKIKCFQAHG